MKPCDMEAARCDGSMDGLGGGPGELNFRSIKKPVRTKHLLVHQMFKETLLCARQ